MTIPLTFRILKAFLLIMMGVSLSFCGKKRGAVSDGETNGKEVFSTNSPVTEKSSNRKSDDSKLVPNKIIKKSLSKTNNDNSKRETEDLIDNENDSKKHSDIPSPIKSFNIKHDETENGLSVKVTINYRDKEPIKLPFLLEDGISSTKIEKNHLFAELICFSKDCNNLLVSISDLNAEDPMDLTIKQYILDLKFEKKKEVKTEKVKVSTYQIIKSYNQPYSKRWFTAKTIINNKEICLEGVLDASELLQETCQRNPKISYIMVQQSSFDNIPQFKIERAQGEKTSEFLYFGNYIKTKKDPPKKKQQKKIKPRIRPSSSTTCQGQTRTAENPMGKCIDNKGDSSHSTHKPNSLAAIKQDEQINNIGTPQRTALERMPISEEQLEEEKRQKELEKESEDDSPGFFDTITNWWDNFWD